MNPRNCLKTLQTNRQSYFAIHNINISGKTSTKYKLTKYNKRWRLRTLECNNLLSYLLQPRFVLIFLHHNVLDDFYRLFSTLTYFISLLDMGFFTVRYIKLKPSNKVLSVFSNKSTWQLYADRTRLFILANIGRGLCLTDASRGVATYGTRRTTYGTRRTTYGRTSHGRTSPN